MARYTVYNVVNLLINQLQGTTQHIPASDPRAKIIMEQNDIAIKLAEEFLTEERKKRTNR